MERERKGIIALYGVNALLAVAIVVMLAVLSSCSRTVYEPVETVRVEYAEADTTGLYEHMRSFFESMYRREASSDSLIDRTKETVVLKENGDTARYDRERIVYRSTSREKELEHKAQQQDSTIEVLRQRLVSAKSDSIQMPYLVEKQPSKWEQTKLDVGGMAIGGIAIAVCFAVIWLIKKIRRK